MPKKEETGPKQPKETRKKRPKSSKEHYEHCKPASVAAPAFRSGLQKPTEYSANWKALSKQLGLQSCKKKEEEIHVRTDSCRESKQGTQANTSFISRAKRRDKSGKSHPRRAATQPRDTLLDSTSTRDKRASVSAKKTKTKATGSQAKVTSSQITVMSSQNTVMSSQNTVTSSRRSAESKWDGTGAKRQREISTSELWFDDVDMEVVRGEPVPKRQRVSLTTGSDSSAGKYVSLDCEMVGTGPEGDFSMLARCSLVNHHGNLLYDSYVAPMDVVTDYRTEYSGIRPGHLRGAPDFRTVQRQVSDLIEGKTLVGHSLHNDLKALLLSHPKKAIRDTSKYRPFRRLAKSKTPSLKKLAKEVLGLDIHRSQHDSIEDARVAMKLYRLHKCEWEAALKAREGVRERRKREGVRGRGGGGSKKSARRENSKKVDTETQLSKLHSFNAGDSGTIAEPFNIMLRV